MTARGRGVGLLLLAATWLGLAAAGFAVWERFDSTPGAAPEREPEPTKHTDGAKWRLVLFAHPHCACTRAGVAELAEIVRASGPDLTTRVVLVCPPGAPDGWDDGEVRALAESVHGVRVECDSGGEEARRAGATTSGFVVLYDPTGRAAFRGGITRGRGRGGDSPGRRAILSLLAGDEPETRETPVFGCSLF